MTTTDTNSQPSSEAQRVVETIPAALFVATWALQALYLVEDELSKRIRLTNQKMQAFMDCPRVKSGHCANLVGLCINTRTQLRRTHEVVAALHAEPEPEYLLNLLETTIRLSSNAARHLALLQEVCDTIDAERLTIHDNAIYAVRQLLACLSTVGCQYPAFVQAVTESQRRKWQQSEPSDASDNQGGE